MTPLESMDAASVVVWLRRFDQVDGERHRYSDVDVRLFADTVPWRTFRWHHGQRHYSGRYWSSTEQAHVIYESRLELACLLFADCDGSVSRIFAQPFLLTARIGGVVRRHVPDFLLLTQSGPVVVDVKPLDRLARPKVAFTIAWTRWAMSLCGWDYEVFSEPPPARLENVRFLAGYRRAWLFDAELLGQLNTAGLDGLTFGEALGRLPGWPQPLVRAALLHLLWAGRLLTDLDRPFGTDTVVRVAAS